MNRKDKLYYDLINAYRNHSCNDTLIDTYIYKVLKIVKDYLNFDNLKKENQKLEQDVKDVLEDYKDAATIMFKLDKAIDIIKCFMNYVEVEFDTFVTSQCTDEEQDLLKEVFGNE